jgi:hypothetical protein
MVESLAPKARRPELTQQDEIAAVESHGHAERVGLPEHQ